MHVSPSASRTSRHADRERRDGEVVLARACVAGVVGGAFLGALVLIPDLVAHLWPQQADGSDAFDLGYLVLAGAFGAALGLVSALAAAVGWLLTVDGPPPRPHFSRLVAGLVAAAVVVVAAVLSGVGVTAVSAAFALVAGVLAATLAPLIGYRSRRVD